MIWELGYDEIVNNTPVLLDAIWDANTTSPNNGHSIVTITTQPAASTIVLKGSISGSLSVAVADASAKWWWPSLSYQWYSAPSNSNKDGTAIPGAINASLPIFTGLNKGTYYYFCQINTSIGAIRSNVATVVVDQLTSTDPPPLPPSPSPYISGPSIVCYSGGNFELHNPPSADIIWTVSDTSIFTVVQPIGITTTVKRKGKGTSSVPIYLYARKQSGNVIDFIKITPCTPPFISGSYYVCGSSFFTMDAGQTNVDINQTTWSVTGTGFSLTKNNGKSTTVNVSSINGQTGVLTGTVDGITCTYPLIADCEIIDDIIEIDGPERFCSSATFSIDGMPTTPHSRQVKDPNG